MKNNLFKNTKKAINFQNEYKRSYHNSLSTSVSNFNPLDQLHQRSFYKRPTKEHIYSELKDYSVGNLEKKIDPNLLTNQQTGYLLELQSIYNELNNSNVTLFTTDPNIVNSDEKGVDDFGKSFSSNKSETELKYLSEFILDEDSEFKRKLGSNSLMSKDTELEVNDIYNCRFKGCSFEEDSFILQQKKLKEIDVKPIVNLPRLDDMVSFEEYKILNNIKTQSFSQVYKEIKNEETNAINNPNVNNMILQDNKHDHTGEINQYSGAENEAEIRKENLNLIAPSEINEQLINDEKMTNSHNTMRTINFAARKHPRIIYKSRDRPPPPKLVRLNNSKKANPENVSVGINVRF